MYKLIKYKKEWLLIVEEIGSSKNGYAVISILHDEATDSSRWQVGTIYECFGYDTILFCSNNLEEVKERGILELL